MEHLDNIPQASAARDAPVLRFRYVGTGSVPPALPRFDAALGGFELRAEHAAEVVPGRTVECATGWAIEVPAGWRLAVSSVSAQFHHDPAAADGIAGSVALDNVRYVGSGESGELRLKVRNLSHAGGRAVQVLAGDAIGLAVLERAPLAQIAFAGDS